MDSLSRKLRPDSSGDHSREGPVPCSCTSWCWRTLRRHGGKTAQDERHAVAFDVFDRSGLDQRACSFLLLIVARA
jgi:hypothetical protein